MGIDDDRSGIIGWDKFSEYLKKPEVQAYFSTQQLDASDAKELFILLDVDGTDEVKLDDFVLGCKKLRGQAKDVDVASLLRETKKSAAKHMKMMRRIESMLIAAGVVAGTSHASWLQSPLSGGVPTPSSTICSRQNKIYNADS